METGRSAKASRNDAHTPEIERLQNQPLDVRNSIREKVLAIRRDGLSYDQIIRRIRDEHGIGVSKSTVSYWTREKANPLGSSHAFVPVPSPELAYVIGVETGDGFLNVKAKRHQYRIRLRAVDTDFVEAFNQAVAKVLNCAPHRLWKGKKARESEVEYGSYLLFKFLSQELDNLKAFVEHDKRCVAAFVRGFFDSEGCMAAKGDLTAFNTDVRLLRYVKRLLKQYFQIETTGLRISARKGTILTNRGKSYTRKADCYLIYVRRAHLHTFQREIGLTIGRKRVRLERKLGLR